MDALRWWVGGLALVFAGSFAAFFAFADCFRRSFGASENAKWKLVLPLGVALLFASASLWPESKSLLCLAGVAVIAVTMAAVRIARAAPVLTAVWLLYAAACLWFIVTALRIAP